MLKMGRQKKTIESLNNHTSTYLALPPSLGGQLIDGSTGGAADRPEPAAHGADWHDLMAA